MFSASHLLFFGVVLGLVQNGFSSPTKRAPVSFFAPNQDGGSELTDAGPGVGEPLNVIISADSDPDVLTDSGFLNFVQSLDFSIECLDIHLGGPQSANLGDGNGFVNQTIEIRQDFGDASLGTCLESLIGGNHLRMFRQNGSAHDTGALFLAVSQEENVFDGHDIEPNGYNIGRNNLVASAIASQTSFNSVTYSTTAENITGLLAAGSDGVNHGISQDGIVTLLTVTIV